MSFRQMVRSYVPLSFREPINRLRWSRGARETYSAFGEDLIFRGWLEEVAKLPPAQIRYLDIGANDPTVLSNSYLLYRIGGSGVLVEPNPADAARLRQKRPRDTVLEVGIAFDDRRSATMYEFPHSVFNTFDPDAAHALDQNDEPWARSERIIGQRQVELVPANDVIQRYFADGCHLLTVDAEGVDDRILSSIDFKTFKPWIVCAEGPRSRLSTSLSVLTTLGYELLAETVHNVILYRQSAFTGGGAT